MHICSLCQHQSLDWKIHVKHHQFHRNLQSKFHCGFNGCPQIFKTENALRMHLFRSHQISSKCSVQQASAKLEAVTPDATFVCNVLLCKQIFNDYCKLLQHLRVHLKDGTSVNCPSRKCEKEFHNTNAFNVHLSKAHRFKNTYQKTSLKSEQLMETENLIDFGETSQSNILNANPDSQQTETSDCNEAPEDVYTQFSTNFTNFLLKLESQFIIPVSTIDYIVQELQNIHKQDQEIIEKNLRAHLCSADISPDKIDAIIAFSINSSPFAKSLYTFSTDHRRKKIYKLSEHYVTPEKVPITSKDEEGFFHYIPIAETIKKTLNNKSFMNVTTERGERDPEVLEDFLDGELFKNNPFFCKNPDALPIVLYQDGLQVTDPLNPASKKYKIIGVYLALGSLPPYVRTHINSIQLVALCKDSMFDHKQVYGRIVSDLKTLEDVGIEVKPGVFKRVGLAFIAGDNAGSHELGGFTENFSTSLYFCRFCPIHRREFFTCTDECLGCVGKSGKHTFEYHENCGELRTIDSFKECVQAIEDDENDSMGVTHDSAFNELSSFHTAMPGLPPCMAHDLKEGVVPYDTMLFIKYMIKKKWFTVNELNKRIENFQYSKIDKRDKPVPISLKKDRISGKAWQVCLFIRLFPLMIGDKVKDYDDEVWRAFLLLSEICDILCSPLFKTKYASYLQYLINEYLGLRTKLFANIKLRPKHHLSHYPELIILFGPLIHVWTLRFEAKHTFFKKTIRIIRNFINVTHTLSEKHELFQTYLRSGGDIRIPIDTKDASELSIDLYSDDIKIILNTINWKHPIDECSSVTIKGTEYCKGNLVILHQESYQLNEQFGKITLILVDSDQNVYLLVKRMKSTLLRHLRLYEVHDTTQYDLVNITDLHSYQALHLYRGGDVNYIRLSHAVIY